MKFLITFLIIGVSFISQAQKFALLDRDYKKPILFTDSITINQVANNYFPVRVQDLDSLIANLEFIKTQLNNIQRSKFKSFRLPSGYTNLKLTTVPHAYGDAYDVLVLTSANNVNAEYLLASNEDLNKKATKKINAFIKYISHDKEIIIKRFVEFQPVILDATIFMK